MAGHGVLVAETFVLLTIVVAAQRNTEPGKVPAVISDTRLPLSTTDPISTPLATSDIPLSTSVSIQPSPLPLQRMDMSESETTSTKIKPTVEPIIPETREDERISVIVSEQETLTTASSDALNQSSGLGIFPSQLVIQTSAYYTEPGIGPTVTELSMPPEFTIEQSTSMGKIKPENTQSILPTPEASIPHSASFLLLPYMTEGLSVSQPLFDTLPPTITTTSYQILLITPSPAIGVTSSTQSPDLLLPTGVPLYTFIDDNNATVIEAPMERRPISTHDLLSSPTIDYLEISTEIAPDTQDISTLHHIPPSSAPHVASMRYILATVQERFTVMQTSVQLLMPELSPLPRSPPTASISSRGDSTASTISPDVEATASSTEILASPFTFLMVQSTITPDILTPVTSHSLLVSPSPVVRQSSSNQPLDLLLPTGIPLYTSIIEDSLTRTPTENSLTFTSVPVFQSLLTITPELSEPVGYASSLGDTISLTTDQRSLIIPTKPLPTTEALIMQTPPFFFQSTEVFNSFVSITTTVEPMMLLPFTSALPDTSVSYGTVNVNVSATVPTALLVQSSIQSQGIRTAEIPLPSNVISTHSSTLMDTNVSSVESMTSYQTMTSSALESTSTNSALSPSVTLSAVTLTSFGQNVSTGIQPSATVVEIEPTPTPSRALPTLSSSEVTGGSTTDVPSSELALQHTNSSSLSTTSLTVPSSQVAIESLNVLQSTSRNLVTQTTESVSSSTAIQSREEKITSSITEQMTSPVVQPTTTHHSTTTTIPSATTISPLSKVTTSTTVPTPSPCNPFYSYTPPPNSIVSIILAVTPLELSKIRESGSAERCQLLEALVTVFKDGLMSKERSVRESRVNTRSKVNLNKRQVLPEPEYTAVITDIAEDDIFGDNLVDVRFFILDTSAPTSPLAANSTTVSEAYLLANVQETSGFTIVRQAEPSEDLQAEDYSPPTDASGLSSRVVVGLISGAAVLAALAVTLVLVALKVIWGRHHQKIFNLEGSLGTARISLVNRTLVPTASFQYESRPIVQQQGSGLSSHVTTPGSSHENIECTSSSSEEAEPSVTSITHLAQRQQMNALDSRPGGSEQGVTTLTHLARSLSRGERESTAKDTNGGFTTEMIESIAHYNSPQLTRRPYLPPLKPRFHYTTSDPQPPPLQTRDHSPVTPPHSPSPTSTFHRVPTPPDVTPTKTETTPKKKKRRRRHRSTRPGSRGDETLVGLLIEEPETKIDDAEQELWLRRRATMEYHKYISGEESTFHPSFLSYKNQPLLSPGSPGLPLLVQHSPPRDHMDYTVGHEQQSPEVAPGSDGETLILEEVEGSEESDSSLPNSEANVPHNEDHVEPDALSPVESEKETKERTKEQKWYGRQQRIFQRNKVAPLTYSTPFSSSVPPHVLGADLAWMDTVNGPQLVQLSRPHLQRPPQYVLPPPQVSTSPPHYHQYPSHTHSQSPHTVVPTHHSMQQVDKQQATFRQESSGSGSEEIDGPDRAEQDFTQCTKEEEISTAPHDASLTAPKALTTDKRVIHKMIGEAFGTSASQKASTPAQEDRVDVNKDRRNAFSQTSPHKTHQVITALPVQVQPIHGATFPGNVQLVWPYPAPQVLQPSMMSPHQNYYNYHPIYNYQPHTQDYHLYGSPIQPSTTSTPRYKKKKSEQH